MILAKKSLGQNFLIDNNIIKKIVNLTDVKNKHIIDKHLNCPAFNAGGIYLRTILDCT